MENSKKFYDIHCHAMDLSHPNLLAFLHRNDLPWYFPIVAMLVSIFPRMLDKYFKKMKNLLAVMENDITDFFLLMEYFLKDERKNILENGKLKIDTMFFDKIVLTPLMMDFGYKNIKTDTFYNIPPKKPIVKQVVDLFNAIKKYSEFELVKVTEKGEIEYDYRKIENKNKKLFEIYPFLALNTKNYTMEKMRTMLEKYFGDYSGKQEDFFRNMAEFDGDIENLGSNNFFGIKLYPPLGFDPSPTDEKVAYLYSFCSEKQIPITIHCSDGGFTVDKNAKKYTDPSNWENILKDEQYSKLKINFAHFGKQGKRLVFFPQKKWKKKILELIMQYPNVYTDFSCIAAKEDYYKSLEELSGKQEDYDKIKQRILFGSDFMINLIWSESYNHYLSNFSGTEHISTEDKELFCSINPERFLFGANKVN